MTLNYLFIILSRLEELLPMHLSWNSKVPKDYDKSRPVINIIGNELRHKLIYFFDHIVILLVYFNE